MILKLFDRFCDALSVPTEMFFDYFELRGARKRARREKKPWANPCKY